MKEYNFSKIEDQGEFDKLPSDKQEKLIDKAHEEALKLDIKRDE